MKHHPWLHATLLVLFLVPTLALSQFVETQEQSAPAGSAVVTTATTVQLDYLDNLPVLTPEMEKARLNCGENPIAPPTPVDPNFTEMAVDPGPATGDQMPEASGDFEIFRNVELGTGAPSSQVSMVNEPSTGNNGNLVFQTGNWYASLSTNAGTNWTYINPYTKFPASFGGFCCDQEAIFDQSRGIMIWLLQYVKNASGNNIYRLAVARNTANLKAGIWTYYDLTPQALGLPTGRWYDYPHIALGSNYLYIAANVFNNSDFWTNTVLLRIPLANLAAGTGFSYNFVNRTDRFNFTPVQGAATTMFWASHNTTSSIRVFRWTEGSTTYFWDDRAHTGYTTTNRGSARCGPIGATGGTNNFCGRFDDRILAGFRANGVVGFMWNVAQGGSFPWPYTRMIRLSEATRTVLSQPVVWNASAAWIYPSVGVNSRGHLGGTIFYGGGAIKPTAYAWIADDYNAGALQPLTNAFVAAGTNFPNLPKWGDYLRSRQHSVNRNTWLATAYTLVGGGNNSNARPRNVWFGRQRDIDIIVNDGFENVTTPWVFATNGTGTFTRVTPGCVGLGKGRVGITTQNTTTTLSQSGLRVMGRTAYRLRMRANSSNGLDMSVYLANASTGAMLTTPLVVNLTTTSCTAWNLLLPATNFDGIVANAKLVFNFGPYDANGTFYYFDDIHFYPNVPIVFPEPEGVVADGSETGSLEKAGEESVPKEFFLEANYPNPFNPTTTIGFGVPEQASVKMEVFDVLGRTVKTLLSGDLQAGYHSALWDGTNGSGALVGSGVYYYRIEATGVSGQKFVNSRKLMLVK
jgi:hypothetical protein